MTLAALAVALAFAAIGAGAERLASVWPADEASHRPLGVRTATLAAVAAAGGGAVALRSTLPAWALGVHLLILAILVLLTATDLEQRRLPHLLLDPLIVIAALFVPFNATGWQSALLGGAIGVAFMGGLGLVVRGGVALGDLLLVAPLGLILGWQAIIVAMFLAGILSAIVSIGLLLTHRAGLRTYIPFVPFLVAGAVIALVRDPELLGTVAIAVTSLRQP